MYDDGMTTDVGMNDGTVDETGKNWIAVDGTEAMMLVGTLFGTLVHETMTPVE